MTRDTPIVDRLTSLAAEFFSKSDASVLGADDDFFDALGIDLPDTRQPKLSGHEELTTAEGEEDGVVAGGLRRSVMGNEGEWNRRL